MLIKKIIKQLSPPILIDTFRLFARRNVLTEIHANQDISTWNKIDGALLKDYEIFVNANRPIFKDMLTGNYDSEIIEFISKQNLKGKTVLDIGSHIGFYALVFSKYVGFDGVVFLFEPNTTNIDRINMNLSRNEARIRNVYVNEVALSNYVGKSKFNFSDNIDDQTSSGGFLEDSFKPLNDENYARAGFASGEVEVVTLDSFVDKHNLKELAFLKIDVEGAEHLVLEGAVKTLEKFKPCIAIEIHSVQAMMESQKILFHVGYETRLIKPESQSRCFIAAEPIK